MLGGFIVWAHEGQGVVFSKKKTTLGIERIHVNISFYLRQKNKARKNPRKQKKFLDFTDEKDE